MEFQSILSQNGSRHLEHLSRRTRTKKQNETQNNQIIINKMLVEICIVDIQSAITQNQASDWRLPALKDACTAQTHSVGLLRKITIAT